MADEEIERIREHVKKLKLQELEEEVRRLQAQKLELQKEKELKLNKVKEQIGLISPKIQASHPVLSELARRFGKGTYQAGKAIGSGAIQIGKSIAQMQQEEREKELALAKKGIYVNNNPIDRLLGAKAVRIKSKAPIRYKVKHVKVSKPKAKVKTLNELKEEVQRLELQKKIKKLAEA